jgi:hypothetical protein
MLGESIFTADEKEVLYDFVTFRLQSKETLSKIDFIIYQLYFSINSETNFPEIKAGGTPGPGTVN